MEAAPGILWDSPLDVSSLAWDSVQQALAAAKGVAVARGSDVTFATSPALVTSSFAAIENLRVDGRSPQAWAPLSGFFRAADGWVRLHGNYPHHARAIIESFGASEREALQDHLVRIPADEIEKAVTARRGIATVVRTADEWNAHAHGSVTASEPWIQTTTGGERAPLPPEDTPLAGLHVLDLTRVIAGPTCAQLLACLGADVLRIDPPHLPELLDQHLSNGMGKRSAELDFRTDLARLREDLLPRADVVLLGYRPGSLAAFGLDPWTLASDRPDLVIASLSAWGEVGPWAVRGGFDSIVQAASGIAVRCGTEEGPGALPVQALDHATGYRLAAEVMTLCARGRGGVVTASLLGAARELLTTRAASGPPLKTTPVTVRVPSPHGELTAVPPPVTVDGQTLERAVRAYGSSPPSWT